MIKIISQHIHKLTFFQDNVAIVTLELTNVCFCEWKPEDETKEESLDQG